MKIIDIIDNYVDECRLIDYLFCMIIICPKYYIIIIKYIYLFMFNNYSANGRFTLTFNFCEHNNDFLLTFIIISLINGNNFVYLLTFLSSND